MTTNNELLQLSHLDTMLARATRIDEITSIRAKLEVLRVYAVNIGKSHEETQTIAMARIKSERKAGQVLLSLPKQNGARPPDTGFIDAIPQDIDGVLPSQRNSWQTIAKLPDELFDKMLLERFQSGDDITTAYFYRAAKIHTMRKAGINTDKPPPTHWHTPEALVTLIKANMNAQQIETLIQLLNKGEQTE